MHSILQAHGIEPAIDLPGVGENLQDHVCVISMIEIDPKFETADALLDPAELAKQVPRRPIEQKGLLSSGPARGFIFLPDKYLGSPSDVQAWKEKADVYSAKYMEAQAKLSATFASGLQKQFDLQKSWMGQDHLAQGEILHYLGHQPVLGLEPVAAKRYSTLVSALMHPLSRGTVHIGSSDPLAPPLIDPNYYANEVDLDILVKITKYTMKLIATPPMAGIVRSHVLPGPEVVNDEAKLRQYVKENGRTVFHPIGTASMLPREDGGVVDSELKVYGTTNLRVADVSILPMELSCHIQSVAYAIGEKAADVLRK